MNFKQMNQNLQIRNNLLELYPDIYTPEALSSLAALAPFNKDIREVMASRIARRAERYQNRTRILFWTRRILSPEQALK